MKKTYIAAICTLFFVFLGNLELLADNKLTWYRPDFPPYIILEGPNKANGIDNQTEDHLIKRLPEYEHSFKVANYERILNDLEDQTNGVVSPLFKTPEREKFLLFPDLPSYLILPNGLIFSRKNKAKFQPFLLDNGMLDIEALSKSKNIKIGITAGRAYTSIIDEVIAKYKDSGIFYKRSGIKETGVLEMVLNGRIDAAFGVPVELKASGFDTELELLRISKMSPYIPIYFGVTKNEWGRTLIGKINKILREKGTLVTFHKYYEYWLTESDKKYYRKYLDEYYTGKADITP